MGVNFRGGIIFKRWSSLCAAVLLTLFFGAMVFFFGASPILLEELTLEQAAAFLLFLLLASAAIWFAFNLGIFSGVEVRDDRVVVKSFLKDTEVSLGAVEEVNWKGGISLRLAKGKRATCVAFPNSLYSFLIGYRNFKGVARSIERVVMDKRAEADDPGEVWGFERERWNLQFFLVILSSYVLLFLLTNVIFRLGRVFLEVM